MFKNGEFDIEHKESIRKSGIRSIVTRRFVPNTRRTYNYIRIQREIFKSLKRILKKRNYSAGININIRVFAFVVTGDEKWCQYDIT